MSRFEPVVYVVVLLGLSSMCAGGAGDTREDRVVAVDPIILFREAEAPMFLGLRTAIYTVEDLGAAKEWYSQVLGFGPYFDEPFYVGFNVGGYELGLLPLEGERPSGLGGVTAYWGVEDIDGALSRLLELGATLHEEAQDVGGDIWVGKVIDPFGNVLGVIVNPHFELPAQ